MASKFFDRKTVSFILNSTHQINELTKLPYFSDHDAETFNMVLDSAESIATKTMFPALDDVDKNQPELVNGEVIVHPSIKDYLKAVGEAGIISADFDYEHGGAQLPFTINTVAGYILIAANNGMLFTGLTSGAARLIAHFGSENLKSTYLEPMLSGKWQGTMCLTEPQAGSSLSDIVTTAEPQTDGTYKIKGQKIFISGGDHNYCDNVVHLLIGRIKGAPAGTKGISLFVVPKFLENGERNDITNVGIYHKMGQRGVPAMHLEFGENCVGYLVGEENKGLSYMFQMMNEARIGVGITGVGISSAAYEAALQYAKERPQSRRLNKKAELNAPQIPIIQHPDVRRLLFSQKAAVEGGLSLVVLTAKYYDLAHHSETSEEKEKYSLLLEFLTPITKTYPCESGLKTTSDALQCFGGYGFTEDFPAEQYYRDIRITPIYEGTTAIHGLDLLGRKVGLANGKALGLLSGEIIDTITVASSKDKLKKYASLLASELKTYNKTLQHLFSIAQTGDTERYLSDATLFLELTGIILISWQWLAMAIAAENALEKGEIDQIFADSKIETMKYYFHYELPKTAGLTTRLLDEEVITILKENDIFDA
ncbi:acyl-CoA dehydrogenase [Lacihabitans sp. LS3-19]|uniref:acyl-CoA dehydrogenase n=1 Tax=Lacihabitans sp. LS3-19 TaxID=2487335 RepID=UPI0020CCC31E|nr:acyl-CoA dehydrogenase [Lacihabitans sp. LS3-19]MCP9768867.1 acyl-CoA dehydrogenase [Lacihabitans sp. LS3-19]